MQRGYCAIKKSAAVNGSKYAAILRRTYYDTEQVYCQYKIDETGTAYVWYDRIEPERVLLDVGRKWRDIKRVPEDENVDLEFYNLGQMHDGLYSVVYSLTHQLFGSDGEDDDEEMTYLAIVSGSVLKLFDSEEEAFQWLRRNYTYIALENAHYAYEYLDLEATVAQIADLLRRTIPFAHFECEGDPEGHKFLRDSNLAPHIADEVALKSAIRGWIIQSMNCIGRAAQYMKFDIAVIKDQLDYLTRMDVSLSTKLRRDSSLFW